MYFDHDYDWLVIMLKLILIVRIVNSKFIDSMFYWQQFSFVIPFTVSLNCVSIQFINMKLVDYSNVFIYTFVMYIYLTYL